MTTCSSRGTGKPEKSNTSELSSLIIATVSSAFYCYSTIKEKNITIASKYKFTRNGNESFIIVDNENTHYSVNNNSWFSKWDSIEDWYTMCPNKNYYIKYYGWRCPVLGLFPNIYYSKLID